MTVKKTILFKGDHFSKKEEKKLHDIMWSNMKDIDNTDEDLVPIIYDTLSTIAPKYHLATSSQPLILTHSFQNKNVHLRTIKRETYDSLVKENMLEYYMRIPLLGGVKVDVGASVFKAVTKVAFQKAAKVAQYAFYFYLFSGVENLMGLNSGLFESQIPFIPDIVVGTMPFYSAQRLERGMSDRLLKYRAIGDIFLAHQRGGTDTLRVDMTLFGPFRVFYLLYLLSLQQRGESRLKELKLLSTGVKAPDTPLPSDVVKVPKEGKVQYESHMTFPIITQTSIMLDMFLQTIEWHQTKDKGGNNIIYIHLLFRKHIEPKGYTVFDGDDKSGHMKYGELASERQRKELNLDILWKAREIGKEMFSIGLFGGKDLYSIDRQAIAEDPYITTISGLTGGFGFELSDAGSIFAMM